MSIWTSWQKGREVKENVYRKSSWATRELELLLFSYINMDSETYKTTGYSAGEVLFNLCSPNTKARLFPLHHVDLLMTICIY